MAMEVHWDLSSHPEELTLRTDVISVFLLKLENLSYLARLLKRK